VRGSIAVVVGALFASAVSCTAPSVVRPFSRAEAIHIADAAARKELQLPLSLFEHCAVFRSAEGGDHWHVAYCRPGHKFPDFSYDVYERTRKAWRVIVD
jgi:hypothetical protein